MVFDIIFITAASIIFGILLFFLHKSSIKILRLLKGLSNIAAFIILFFIIYCLFRYISAVTAPIDLPQSPIDVTAYFFFKWLRTSFKSYHSYQPNEINSPSEFPHPLKSNVKREIP